MKNVSLHMFGVSETPDIKYEWDKILWLSTNVEFTALTVSLHVFHLALLLCVFVCNKVTNLNNI